MDSDVIDLVTGVIGFLSALLSFVAALPAITRIGVSRIAKSAAHAKDLSDDRGKSRDCSSLLDNLKKIGPGNRFLAGLCVAVLFFIDAVFLICLGKAIQASIQLIKVINDLIVQLTGESSAISTVASALVLLCFTCVVLLISLFGTEAFIFNANGVGLFYDVESESPSLHWGGLIFDIGLAALFCWGVWTQNVIAFYAVIALLLVSYPVIAHHRKSKHDLPW